MIEPSGPHRARARRNRHQPGVAGQLQRIDGHGESSGERALNVESAIILVAGNDLAQVRPIQVSRHDRRYTGAPDNRRGDVERRYTFGAQPPTRLVASRTLRPEQEICEGIDDVHTPQCVHSPLPICTLHRASFRSASERQIGDLDIEVRPPIGRGVPPYCTSAAAQCDEATTLAG